MNKEKVTSEVKMVPFDQIEVDEADNVRQSGVNQAKIKQLAESIDKHTMLEAIGVTNGTPNRYKVCYGFKRYAALKLLGWKGDRLVPVMVHKTGVVANLVENIQRDDPSTADIALRVLEMVDGDHPLQPGEAPPPKRSEEIDTWRKARAFDKKDLASQLGFTPGYVANLLRLARLIHDLPSSVGNKIRKESLPARLLVELPAMTKKEKVKVGKDEEGNEIIEEHDVPNIDKIEKRIDEWIATRKEMSSTDLEGGGDKQPKKRKSKNKIVEAKDVNPTAMTMRVEVPDEVPPLEERLQAMKEMKKEAEAGGKVTEKKAQKVMLTPSDYVRLLSVKLNEAKNQAEKARLEAYRDAFRFMTGELDKLPGITQKDWDVFLPEKEETEE